MNWSQPFAEVRKYPLPLFDGGGMLLPPVLPYIAMYAASVAEFGKKETDAPGAAAVSPAPAAKAAQPVVDPFVDAVISRGQMSGHRSL